MSAVLEELLEHSTTHYNEIEGMNPDTTRKEKIARIFFMSAAVAELVEHSATDFFEIEGMNPDTAWEDKIAMNF